MELINRLNFFRHKFKNQYLTKKIRDFPLLRQKRRDHFQKISGILSRDRMTLVIFGIFSFNFDKKCPLEFSRLKFLKLKRRASC